MRRHKHIKKLALYSHAACLMLFIATIGVFSMPTEQAPMTGVPTVSAPPALHSAPEVPVVHAPVIAAPLAAVIDRRLQNQGIRSPGLAELTRAINNREDLLTRTVMITLATNDNPVFVQVKLADHPEWVRLRQDALSADFIVDPVAVEQTLRANGIKEVPLQHTAIVTAMNRDGKNVMRASTEEIAKAGYAFDVSDAAGKIADAFTSGYQNVTIDTTFAEPSVTIQLEDGKTKTLHLLATGISDFAGSPEGRVHNVLKAIDERIHNAVIPAGETFSVVAALDAPITLEKGWVEEMGLFGGGAALTVGAGICQSATTVYRAALLAGLPIVEKRNHSLYVDHYQPYGVGLDATIFPNVHDMRFSNDTGEDIVMQAYTDGPTVYVNLYGKKDGRTATFDGPYFSTSKTRPAVIEPLDVKQIAWVRTMTYANGDTVNQPIYATYAKPFWHSIKVKYEGADGMKLLAGEDL